MTIIQKKLEFIKTCMKGKTFENISDAIKLIIDNKNENYNSINYLHKNENFKIFKIFIHPLRMFFELVYFNTVYITILLEFILFLYYILRYKKYLL